MRYRYARKNQPKNIKLLFKQLCQKNFTISKKMHDDDDEKEDRNRKI